MRRRDFLAGAAGLGVVGAGAAVGLGAWNPFDDGTAVDPLELAGIEAPGSDAGTVTVPAQGTVSLVEFFATWCGSCQLMMEDLPDLHAEVGEEIQFVSVTNQQFRDEDDRGRVADWWVEHGGAWQIAHDDDLELTGRLDASGVPYSVVLDADNRVTYADGGHKPIGELRDRIDAARS